MNNSQFRKLLVDTPARQGSSSTSQNGASATPRGEGATPSALGSRMRSSIPMTPRSLSVGSGNDFARQLAERNAAANPAVRKFKTSKVRGARLADGYTDRTKSRIDNDEDDKAKRIKSLEEMMKLQQIDQETFEKLRDEIVGGDVASVHLVKGLDYKLLERVRRGEDVLSRIGEDTKEEEEEDEEAEDVEYEFDELEDKEVTTKEREERTKKGEMAPPSLMTGQKRTRNQILAEMKAARLAAKEAAQPALGSKFKKVGTPRITSRIERDGKGREILITIDENGNEKRKVRRVQIEPEFERGHGLLMPDKDVAPLGMEVPSIPEPPIQEEEDIDIFDDAGDDYDPLAGLSGSDSEDDIATEDGEVTEQTSSKLPDSTSAPESDAARKEREDSISMPPPPTPTSKPTAPRNYFNEKPSASQSSSGSIAMSDPTILAALKKASTLSIPSDTPKQTEEEKALAEKRRRMLQQDDRDAEDMDMGFGSSRLEDEADLEDDGSTKLSNWGGGDDADDKGKKGKKERKRGGQKRKGDVNNAADVLKVIERRKAEK